MTLQFIMVSVSFLVMAVLNFILERQNKKLQKIIQGQQITLNEHNSAIIPTIIENLRFHLNNAVSTEEYEKAKEYSEMIMKLEGFLEDDSVVINATKSSN